MTRRWLTNIQDMSWNGFKKERSFHPLTYIWKLLWQLRSALMKTDIFSQWPGLQPPPLAIMITIQPYYVTDRSWRDCLWMRIQYLGQQDGLSLEISMTCHIVITDSIPISNVISLLSLLSFLTHIPDNKIKFLFLSNVYSDLEKLGHSLKWFIRQSGVMTLFLPFLCVPSSNDK